MDEENEDLKIDAYLLVNAAFNEKTGRDLQETDLDVEVVESACGEVVEYLSFTTDVGSKAYNEAKREAKNQAANLKRTFEGKGALAPNVNQ